MLSVRWSEAGNRFHAAPQDFTWKTALREVNTARTQKGGYKLGCSLPESTSGRNASQLFHSPSRMEILRPKPSAGSRT